MFRDEKREIRRLDVSRTRNKYVVSVVVGGERMRLQLARVQVMGKTS